MYSSSFKAFILSKIICNESNISIGCFFKAIIFLFLTRVFVFLISFIFLSSIPNFLKLFPLNPQNH